MKRRNTYGTQGPDGIDALLKQAAHVQMTPAERFEQKVSFVYSCVAGDGITKDQVRSHLISELCCPSSDKVEQS